MVSDTTSDLLVQIPDTPANLSSKSRQWISLVVVMISCMLAASPMGSFATLEPLLVKGHLFNGDKEKLASVYSVAAALTAISALPAGIFYDMFGGRAAGCFGAFLMAVALLSMSFALWSAPRFSWIFFLGYPLGASAGSLTVAAMYPFLYIFPRNQAFVMGAFSASISLSETSSALAVYLDGTFDLHLQILFACLAAICTITIAVCYLLVPSRAWTVAKARDVEGLDASKPNLTSQFRKTWRCLVKYRFVSSLYVSYNIAIYGAFAVISGNLYPYYGTMFGDEDTAHLCDVFALVYGLGSGIMSLLGGCFCDLVGVVRFTIAQVFVIGLTMLCIATPGVWVQYLGQFLLTVSMGQYLVLTGRLYVMYSQSDVLGMYSGVTSVFVGLGNAILSTVLNSAIETNSSTDSFKLAFLVSLGLAVFFGSALVFYWCRYPPPSLEC